MACSGQQNVTEARICLFPEHTLGSTYFHPLGTCCHHGSKLGMAWEDERHVAWLTASWTPDKWMRSSWVRQPLSQPFSWLEICEWIQPRWAEPGPNHRTIHLTHRHISNNKGILFYATKFWSSCYATTANDTEMVLPADPSHSRAYITSVVSHSPVCPCCLKLCITIFEQMHSPVFHIPLGAGLCWFISFLAHRKLQTKCSKIINVVNDVTENRHRIFSFKLHKYCFEESSVCPAWGQASGNVRMGVCSHQLSREGWWGQERGKHSSSFCSHILWGGWGRNDDL